MTEDEEKPHKILMPEKRRIIPFLFPPKKKQDQNP
jgi:hypothetical protein